MSDRRAHMARSSLIVMAAFAAAKLIGLLRERAIAHQFGATAEYDAYIAAFKIPDLLFMLIAGGALVSAFLPVFADALARDDEDEAWTIASGVTNVVFAVTLVLAALAAMAAPWLVQHIIAPGFNPAQQALAADLMRIVLVSTLVFAVSGIQMGILNAYQHFLLPALAPIAYNFGILIGALWLAPRYGIRGLAYGVVIGAVLHLLVKVPGLAHYGFRYKPIAGLHVAGVRLVLWLMWPRVLALGTVQVVLIVSTALASALTTGSLSALNYAWIISQMPQTILGTAVATVAFPTLAEYAALGRLAQLRATTVGALRVLIALSVPAAVGLWVLGPPLIDILLRTGRFDQTAADATLAALRMFALGLVGHVMLEVVARAFYAQKNTLTPLYIAVVAMVLNVTLALLLVRPLLHAGLALANSVAVSLEVVLALWILGRMLNGIEGRVLAATLGRALASAAAMAAAMTASLRLLPDEVAFGTISGPFVTGLVQATIGGLVGVAVYVAAATIVGMPEVREARGLLRSALGRR
jgi:putative peptidoglycan lipid II flippase